MHETERSQNAMAHFFLSWRRKQSALLKGGLLASCLTVTNVAYALSLRTLCAVMLCLVFSLPAMAEDAAAPTNESIQKAMSAKGDGAGVVLCPTCPVVAAFTRGGLKLTKVLAEEISKSLSTLVGVFLGIWMLIQAGKLLFPFGSLDRASKILNETFGRVGLGVMIILMIQSSSLYMNYILYPLIDSTLSFSSTLLNVATSKGNDAGQGAGDTTVDARGCPVAGDVAIEDRIVNGITNQTHLSQRSIGLGLCSAMRMMGFDVCFQGKANSCAAPVAAPSQDWTKTFFEWGAQQAKNAFKGLEGFYKNATNLVNFAGMVSTRGVGGALSETILRLVVTFLIIFSYGYLWMIYPVYMLDIIFKWCMISIFFPILAVAAIFPSTRNTTVAAMKGLGHAALTLVFMSAILGIIISITNQMFLDDKIMKEMASSSDQLVMASTNYWVILICSFIMTHMVKQAPKMAGYFIESKIDANLADGLISAIKKAIETGVNVAIDVASAGGSAGVRNALKAAQAAAKVAIPK